ncbi:hypothetical protein EYC80_004472 [Monilinia laxa]|uniref:Uncharacterized protein n=1 Tax=Monilinia laxa TaxID=61186 RepID=A0A5N6KNI8_MONLA|nr:hypothetical protein EYC80_004472 [Monilinia laxa]
MVNKETPHVQTVADFFIIFRLPIYSRLTLCARVSQSRDIIAITYQSLLVQYNYSTMSVQTFIQPSHHNQPFTYPSHVINHKP